MGRTVSKGKLTVFILLLFVLLITMTLWFSQQYMLFSLIVILLAVVPFFYKVSNEKMSAREIVLMALMGALAAVSRVPFAPLPSVQPTTFVVMVTGASLGPLPGFITGTLAALVSNLFLGQGPWTPWQMVCWGLIGLSCGLLKDTKIMKNKKWRAAFGLIIGFLFGWVMNLWGLLGMGGPFTLPQVIAYYVASFYFDLAHGISNVVFLWFFYEPFYKSLNRFRAKYGLFID